MDVDVQVFSYREDGLESTLDAYAAQEVPEWADVTFRACVTPREELRSSMVEHAERHDTFELLRTPPGKLTSRNVAHEKAVEEGADVILIGDADAPPLRKNYLTKMLRPFREPDVAAVNSTPVSLTPLGATVINTAGFVEDAVRPHLHGQGSGFTASSWQAVGPFDTSIDETDISQVRAVEEFQFYRNLKSQGRIVRVYSGLVRNDSRRVDCRIQRSKLGAGGRSAHCRRTTDSSVTFAPRNDEGQR